MFGRLLSSEKNCLSFLTTTLAEGKENWLLTGDSPNNVLFGVFLRHLENNELPSIPPDAFDGATLSKL